MDTLETIVDVLKTANKPLRSTEIAELTSLEKSVVDKAIKKLVKEEKIYSPVRCCYSVRKTGDS